MGNSFWAISVRTLAIELNTITKIIKLLFCCVLVLYLMVFFPKTIRLWRSSFKKLKFLHLIANQKTGFWPWMGLWALKLSGIWKSQFDFMLKTILKFISNMLSLTIANYKLINLVVYNQPTSSIFLSTHWAGLINFRQKMKWTSIILLKEWPFRSPSNFLCSQTNNKTIWSHKS